ncbi:MAG: transcriptional regulator, NifA subfamily, Fis Family [Labilithrix sp.]|nr:transcriptional regulator, NifA subfamily, Fis Family [Labilithrix sp.]
MKNRSVGIVDDDNSAREAMAGLVRSAGFSVETFSSAFELLERSAAVPLGCLVLDVDLPGLSGLELQRKLAGSDVVVPVIFVTGHGDIPMSVQAIKAGALEFFTKPFDAELLLHAISDGLARSARAEQKREPRPAEPVAGDRSFDEIVGASPGLRSALDQVRTVAATDATVLIRGETGTGKELIARAVHQLSDRRNGPFIKINCGAIPAGLLESELMGHERGAFTGAVERRIGRFELAQDGTIFLDEIGELALELQPKLLRLLQEREFERVGGSKTLRSNARLVAATHRDLGAMVAERTFREDLFYRLNVFPVEMPPLRERRQDIPLLVEHFVREQSRRLNRNIRSIPPATLSRLTEYDWPGNIRELQNVLERAVIMAEDGVLAVPALTCASARSVAHVSPSADDLASVNKAHILTVLDASGWVVGGPNGAAARLGVKRSTLNFRMKKLGISRADARR